MGTANVSRRYDYEVGCFTCALLVYLTIHLAWYKVLNNFNDASYFALETLHVTLRCHVNVSLLFQSG